MLSENQVDLSFSWENSTKTGYECSTVSFMLSGLETRSLGVNKLGTTKVSSLVTVCSSQSYVHGFLGFPARSQIRDPLVRSPQR